MKTSFYQTLKLLALSLAFVTSIVAAGPEILVEKPVGSTIEGGAVVGWGYTVDGQVPVPAGLTSVKAIAAGVRHCLALKANGEVVGWGDNSLGQASPPFAARSGVKSIAAGDYFSMALKFDGTVVLWGNNSFGELNPPVAPSTTLTGVRAIAAGGSHGMALMEADGSIVSWGDNSFNVSTPPPGLLGVKAIAAGALHSVAILSDDSVIAWGLNSAGRTTIPAGLGPVQAIATGPEHTLALKPDGTVVAWGYNAYGQCTIPSGLTDVKAIAGGGSHSLALKADGSVIAWGLNTSGQLTLPANAGEVQAIAAGDRVSLAVTSVIAYGNQTVGSSSAAKTFTIHNTGDAALIVSGIIKDGGDEADFIINTTGMLSSVPAGGQTTFSVTFTPTALGKRKTTLRVLNDDTDENSFPIYLNGIGLVAAPEIAVDAPGSPSLGGNVSCWGSNNAGQIFVPPGLKGVLTTAAGLFHTLALKNDGTVVAWGNNSRAQTTIPEAAQTGVKAIAASFYSNLALKNDGSVVFWGDSNLGEWFPPQDLRGVVAISASGDNFMALTQEGLVVA